MYIFTSNERRSKSRLKVHISRHVSSWIPSFWQQLRRSSWRGSFGVRFTPTVIFVVLLPKSFSALQKYLKYSIINVNKRIYTASLIWYQYIQLFSKWNHIPSWVWCIKVSNCQDGFVVIIFWNFLPVLQSSILWLSHILIITQMLS